MNTLRSARANFVRLALLLTAVGVLWPAPASAQQELFTISPCRVVDTRELLPGGSRNPDTNTGTPLVHSVSQSFQVAGTCGIPSTAKGVVVMLAAVNSTNVGNIVLYEDGTAAPITSNVNFRAGENRASNTFVALSASGKIAAEARLNGAGNKVHFVVDVTGYLDQPTVVGNDVLTLDEDAAATTIDVLANDSDPDDTLSIVSASDPANGTVNLTPPTLTYQPDANYCNTPPGTTLETFTYTLNTGATGTVTVTVNCVNDAPAGTDKSVGTSENTDYTFAAADFGFTDPNDTPANTFQAVTITTLPSAGTLKLSGSPVTAGQSIAVANIPNLTFSPATGGNGTPYTTFTFQVQDDGGTANSGVDLDASPNTITINVNGVNDAPAGTDGSVTLLEDGTHAFAAAEFGFTDPNDTPPNTFLAVTITTLPTAGSLTLSGNPVVAGQSIPVASLGNLVFTPAANANGTAYATFTFQVQDNGGTAGGGVDLDQSPNTLTLDVTAVNDAPAGTNKTISMLEGGQYTFAAADFGFTDPIDTPANLLQSVVITTLPAAGSLTLSGAPFAAGTEISLANITGGNLKFAPAAGASGAPYTTFTFQVRDDGGTANGGVDLDASANTITIDVTAVNSAPAGTNKTVTTLEDTQYTFTVADFGFTDPNDTPADAFQSVVITTLPAVGSLTLSGAPFAAGTEITVANITAGNLKFTPAANGSGAGYASFTFQVRDDGGTVNGGIDLDPTPNTMTIDVTAVNDAPAGTDGTVSAFEDTQYTFTAANFGFTDPNDTPPNALASVVITTLPAAGSLTLSGAPFAAGTEISLANITAGNLKFTPAANAAGSPYTTFTFQVRDDGGTANGGVDLDASANTLTIDVTAVNDAPAGTNGTVTAFEDTQYTFTAADFGFTDPNDTPANTLASVVITTLPGAGTLTLSGSPFAAGTEISLANITAGNLRFTPAANASGNAYASFTFQVRDNGGTANGGVDLDASANTLTINVTAVNDAPAGTNGTVSTFEETQYTFTGVDFGFTDPNDSPANTLASVVITTLPAAGSLTLSGSPFAAGTEISVTDINLGNLKFTPAANGFGTPYASFTFQVRDNGGTANGGVDLDPSANTMTINVTAINDAPAGTNNTVTAFEDTQYTFTAANFGFTDPNDSPANALASVVITTLPAAGTLTLSGSPFPAGTEISVTDINAGNLKFLAAANAAGSPYTTFTFQVRDDGGTANGGVDLDSTPNTMTINVTGINDAPAGIDSSVNGTEDTLYTFTLADFGFSDPNDSPANSLQSVVISTLPGLGTLTLSGSPFAAGTEISVANITAGNLKYLGAANGFGTPYTSFTFRVRDNGGTANGGVDLDPTPNTVTINLAPVNDPPVADNDTFDFIGNTELRVDVAAGSTPAALETTPSGKGVVDGDSDPVENDPISVTAITVGACTDNSAPLDCSDPAVGRVQMQSNGSFTFEPAPGDTGATETFSYTLTDTGTPAPASTTATVTLTRFERVWYVDPAAAGGGNGTSVAPLNALTTLNGAGGAGDVDSAGDYIFIYSGTLAGAVELEANQHLIGHGAGLSIPVNLNANGSPTSLLAASTRPQVTNASGDTVKVTTAMPVEIRGLSLASSSGNAIDLTTAAALTGSSTLTITDNQFRGATAEGIDVNLNVGTTGTLTLSLTNNTWDPAGAHAGNAVDINRVAGTLRLDFSNNTGILSTGANAVVINGGAAANTTITGFANNSVHQNTAGTGISVSNVTFDSNLGTANLQTVSGGSTVIGTSGDGVGGAGLVMSAVIGDLGFTDLDVFASNGAAVSVAGTGSFTGAAGTRFTVGAGVAIWSATGGPAADVSQATIDLQLSTLTSTNSSTTGVALNNVAGTFSAGSSSSISNTTGTGFQVGSSSANVTYDGTVTTTTGKGVDLTSNSGTIGFTGTLSLSSGANTAFNATGGGTVTATNTSSTLTSTTGTALNVANTTIGAGGLNFRSISAGTGASGPASGIVLNTTGSSGGLTVSGSGSAGSGGTIQRTTGAGISLTSTSNVSLSWMNVQNGGDDGIRGSSVTGFTLNRSTVSANGNAAGESGLDFSGLFGTASITNSTITGSAEDNAVIRNSSGTLSSLTVTGSTFSSNSSIGNDGLLIDLTGTANVTANVSSSTFTANRGDHFQGAAANSAVLNVTFSGNTLTGGHATALGQGITINAATAVPGFSGSVTYTLSNNSINGAILNAIQTNLGTSAAGATMSGTISNNVIGTAGSFQSCSTQGSGIGIDAHGNGTHTVLVSGNTIRQCFDRGITVLANDGSGTLNLTVTGNNSSHSDGTNSREGFFLNAGSADPNIFGVADAHFVCLNLGGAGALSNTLTHGPGAPDDFRIRQRFSTTVRLPGYAGSATDTAAVVSYVLSRNSATTGSATFSSPPGGGFVGGAACPVP